VGEKEKEEDWLQMVVFRSNGPVCFLAFDVKYRTSYRPAPKTFSGYISIVQAETYPHQFLSQLLWYHLYLRLTIAAASSSQDVSVRDIS